jgi:cytochrome o ubiquinol oxidase operon protein cyoD
MNVANEALAGHGPHAAHGAHGSGHGPSQKQYIIGFVLAILLTAVPFALVMGHSGIGTGVLIAAFAVAQIVVHVVYFLHVNNSPEQRWNLTALLYTVLMVGIIMIGSLWIMNHLYRSMAPGAMPHRVWSAKH